MAFQGLLLSSLPPACGCRKFFLIPASTRRIVVSDFLRRYVKTPSLVLIFTSFLGDDEHSSVTLVNCFCCFFHVQNGGGYSFSYGLVKQYKCISIYIHTHRHIDMCIYICVCVYICVRVCVYMFGY